MQHLLNRSPGSAQSPPPGSYTSQKKFPCSGSHHSSPLPLDSQQPPSTEISSLSFGFIWLCSDCLVLETTYFVSLQYCLLANTPSKLQSILAFSSISFLQIDLKSIEVTRKSFAQNTELIEQADKL